MSLFRLGERRANLENPSVPISSQTLAELFTGPTLSSGVAVSERSALNFSAVWRCTSVISNVSSALPLNTHERGTFAPRRSLLLENPHDELTPLEFWRLSYVHRCLWGNFYAQKIRNGAGQMVWLAPLSPDRVKVGRVKPRPGAPLGSKVFAVQDESGHTHALTSAEVFHLPGLGYDGVTGVSPVRAAKAGIGLALAAEDYGARLFGAGSLLSGVLQTEQRLDEDQAYKLKARWQEKVAGLAKAHEIAVLDSGAKFQPITMPNEDAQFLQTRDFQVSDLARFFGVPPFLLMQMDKATSWGTGLEQQALGFVEFDLHPTWLAPTEQRITKELLGDPNVYARYDVEGLLRGDSTARAAFYSAMRTVGAFSANDIRRRESLPPVEGGDTYLQPLNMAPLGTKQAPTTQGAPDAQS